MSLISMFVLTILFVGTTVQVLLEFKKLHATKESNPTVQRLRKWNGQFAKDIGVTYTSLRKNYNLSY